jgi:hypothetical protein
MYLDVQFNNRIIADLDLANLRVTNKRKLPPPPGTFIGEVHWSHSNDDLLFVVAGMGIYRYSLTSNSYTLIKDLTGRVPADVAYFLSRGFSRDDNRVHLMPRNSSYVSPASIGPSNYVYDIQLDRLLGPFKISNDKANLTGDGTMILSNDGVFAVDTGVMEPTVPGNPDNNEAHADFGVQHPFIGDSSDPWCSLRLFNESNLAGYHTMIPCSGPRTVWDAGDHYSIRNHAEDWVTISVDGGSTPALFMGEIFQLPTSPSSSNAVNRRYLHHHSDLSFGYWAEPHANVSQDGAAIAFGSTYNNGRIDLYLFATSGTPGCSYTLSPTGLSVDATASSGVILVTPSASTCAAPTASSSVPWATASASGNTVSWSVTANPGGQSRTGLVTIAGQSVVIIQSGASCSYALSATSLTVGAAGSTGSISVTPTPSNCAPATASSNVSWASAFTSGSTVSWSVRANTSWQLRNGSLSVSGQTVSITQSGATWRPLLLLP